ncbi:hypothetical protein AA13595_0064 [Gluconacetobacter johannae DSM 13595]|uniref:ClpX-type ZB domain-containing protein n=1 Tax=Gluconacetobacter johannae TaxID=112140 RepID=A0A7W4J8N0_9PROT|nr:hypothetical protein [Gluconacetobacter johannae]GBQ79571.1 hypothetical protein AA13595_0064 [Gluconacetobacter johannae DSM 13595]
MNEALRCSFCGKSQNEVKKLIAAPNAFICDECVAVCIDVITTDKIEKAGKRIAAPFVKMIWWVRAKRSKPEVEG